MINEIHARLHRPEKGWDPVPPSHVQTYAAQEWNFAASGTVSQDLDDLESQIGKLSGKRILDLGGGPGQYSIGMAERGAIVTWHDVSAAYREVVLAKAKEHNIIVETSLGYLEEAAKLSKNPFDIVFNRICWRYCMDDRRFAKVIYTLIVPGGYGVIHEEYDENITGGKRKILIDLYKRTGIKIGHLCPTRGVIVASLSRFPVQNLTETYDKKGKRCDVIFQKPFVTKETKSSR